MAGIPEPPDTLRPPGVAGLLSVPLAAGALAALIAATGRNESLFRAVNAWPAATGDALWANVTELGEAAAVLAACVVLIGRRPRLLWAVVIAALLCTAVSQPIKHLVGLPRPLGALGADAVHVIGPPLKKNSFPSGHATTAFAAAALACSALRRWRARAAVLAAATLVAASRLAVGAHWPLDALGGAAVGWLGGGVGLHLAARWEWGVGQVGRLVIAALPLLGAVVLWLPSEEAEPVLLKPVLATLALLVGVPAWIREARRLRSR